MPGLISTCPECGRWQLILVPGHMVREVVGSAGNREEDALADLLLLADAEAIAAGDHTTTVIDGRRPGVACACGDPIDVRDLARLSCMREDVSAKS